MSEKKRMANLELLRCIAMMMVVVLHYYSKGYILPPMASPEETGSIWLGWTGSLAWLIEAFCIVAVNVYMFISGYFLCVSSFKLSRLVQLWLQLLFYSVFFGVIGAATGVIVNTDVDTHYFLSLLFPVTMGHYWFMTAYIFLYMLLPFIGMAVKKLSKEQLQVAIVVLLTVFCIAKSILPFRMEMDQKGYDCLWYLCVFVTAGYIRRFGIPFLEKKSRAIAMYVMFCVLTFVGTYLLRVVYVKTGSLQRMVTMCMEYNHIFPFLAAMGLFAFFLKVDVAGKTSCVINKIAPHALGVYLMHENLGLRYSWQVWLGSDRINGIIGLLLWTLLAVVSIFCCGVLVDVLRSGLFQGVNSILMELKVYRWIREKIDYVDGLFSRVGENVEDKEK